MRKIKTRYIWISVLIAFLIAVGLIVAVTFTEGAWTQVVIVLIAATFIYMTIAIQIASTKTFRYKPKPKNYPHKTYLMDTLNLDEPLKKLGYKPRVAPYGISYLKIQGTDAFKVVLIRNCEKYFNPEKEETPSNGNKSLEKCKRFIGIEVFYQYDEDTLRKLPDFSLQGNNIYYSGLYVEENKLICPNYIEPNDTFSELYQNIKLDLGLREDIPSEE